MGLGDSNILVWIYINATRINHGVFHIKVIETSNFDNDNYPEKLVSEIGLTNIQANVICGQFNSPLKEYSSKWHMVVEDEYVLDDGDPNT
jgi:hypothetical protein